MLSFECGDLVYEGDGDYVTSMKLPKYTHEKIIYEPVDISVSLLALRCPIQTSTSKILTKSLAIFFFYKGLFVILQLSKKCVGCDYVEVNEKCKKKWRT